MGDYLGSGDVVADAFVTGDAGANFIVSFAKGDATSW